MKYEFVGGSKDGAMIEVHPQANYKLRVPIKAKNLPLFAKEGEFGEWSELFGVTVFGATKSTEQYQLMKDGKFHFMGYHNG